MNFQFEKMLLQTCVKDNNNSNSITWYSLKGLVAVSDNIDHWAALDYCEAFNIKVIF